MGRFVLLCGLPGRGVSRAGSSVWQDALGPSTPTGPAVILSVYVDPRFARVRLAVGRTSEMRARWIGVLSLAGVERRKDKKSLQETMQAFAIIASSMVICLLAGLLAGSGIDSVLGGDDWKMALGASGMFVGMQLDVLLASLDERDCAAKVDS